MLRLAYGSFSEDDENTAALLPPADVEFDILPQQHYGTDCIDVSELERGIGANWTRLKSRLKSELADEFEFDMIHLPVTHLESLNRLLRRFAHREFRILTIGTTDDDQVITDLPTAPLPLLKKDQHTTGGGGGGEATTQELEQAKMQLQVLHEATQRAKRHYDQQLQLHKRACSLKREFQHDLTSLLGKLSPSEHPAPAQEDN